MKNFMKQLLILGGFYFIISFIIPLSENFVLQIIELSALLVFVLSILILCFKKKFKWIEKIQIGFPKISNFLSAFGFVEYWLFFFIMIPGAIDGYNAALAEYEGTAYDSALSKYLYYSSYVYIVVFIAVLLWAAYKSFVSKAVRQ